VGKYETTVWLETWRGSFPRQSLATSRRALKSVQRHLGFVLVFWWLLNLGTYWTAQQKQAETGFRRSGVKASTTYSW